MKSQLTASLGSHHGKIRRSELREGLRAGATGLVVGWPFAVLAVWLVVAGLLARRTFRWTA